MSRSLTDGLVVAVFRIGHRGRQTSLLQISKCGFFKNMACGRKVNRREEPLHRFFDAARRMNDPDVLRQIQTILNFKYPQLRIRWESDSRSYDISTWE
jgi:hypothetical protein